MPPWHLYLKLISFAALGAFTLWVTEDFWPLLLVAGFAWLLLRRGRPTPGSN